MFRFENQTVLVTGGTSGIGSAIAQAFSDAGASVVAAGLPDLDVSDQSSIDRLCNSIPHLHILINAAGIIRRDEEYSPEVFAQVLDVNLNGAMRMTMAAYPKLRATRGTVVNIASMLSFFGGPRVPGYSASKGGIAQLTRSLAVAWAPEGIRVNAVAPGWIATPLTDALRADPARSAALLGRTPMNRWGRPEEIAGPVLFLCSEAASFITGAILTVDGGYSSA